MKKERKQTICLTLSKEVLEKLKDISKDESRSRSNMVEYLVLNYKK